MNREEILKILSSYDLTEEEKEYLYLQLYFTNQLNSKSDEEILQMHKEQKKNRDSILNEIAKIMLSYSIVESIMSISKSDKLKLHYKINGLINSKIQSELKYETIKTGQLLKYIGENKYNTNNYIDSLGMKADCNLLPVKQDILDKIINTKVDGKFWSDRLWNNKNQTAADLRNEIKKFLKGETTVNQIEDIIKNKYDSNAFNTKRLVVDNIARVQEGMNDVWREDHNIKRVLYLATLCHNTCSNCSQYDGKEYLADRKPVDLPQHNFCRCTYINLPYKGWRPSERLDNETKERIIWQTYKEWIQNYNNGLDNDNKLLNIPENTLKHVNEGDFTNPKNPKKIKPGEIRLKGGGHSQRSIELLNDKKIEYNIVKEYDNGVRIGNVPKHKLTAKQNGTGQAWFPKDWTDKDIQKAAEYVANLKHKSNYIIEKKYNDEQVSAIFKYANYKGVTVGVCYETNRGKITTIFPDETQRMLGGYKDD